MTFPATLRKLSDAATQGEWRYYYEGSGDYCITAKDADIGTAWSKDAHFLGLGKEADGNEINAQLICLLANRRREILALAEAAQTVVDEMPSSPGYWTDGDRALANALAALNREDKP